ncbi:MAG: type 2 lantipeptide synthetase LanM [Moorea sp. SIO4A3]|nr:type 2 lantipeptide synthetase LanM [Moorena sp. SIO4A3]
MLGRSIVAKASFWWERLDIKQFVPELNSNSEAQVSQRLERWCNVVAQGNWDKFQRRLQWDGLDIDQVRPCLGTVRLVAEQLPKWANTLAQVMETAKGFQPQDYSDLPINLDNPLPFEDLLLPVVVVARAKLQESFKDFALPVVGQANALLSKTAYRCLERTLLQQVTTLCAKTLNAEFSKARPGGYRLLNLLLPGLQGNGQTTYYDAFVEQHLGEGYLTLVQNYPVLGRLVATCINLWLEATVELLQRLRWDYEAIEQMFGQTQTSEGEPATAPLKGLGQVTDIQTGLSDPHNGGRSVFVLTFESGLKVVYKPKDLGLEVAFNNLLAWCNQHEELLKFKVLRVLNQSGYGWVEYVEHQPCENEAAAQRFYQRAGMLLCWLYALRGIDCHYENLIASGEHLVLVDLETLLDPEVKLIDNSLDAQEMESTAGQQFYDSVLRTGLLPRWDFSSDRRIAYDISGLGSIESQPSSNKAHKARCWKAINTDDMHLGYDNITLPRSKNVPYLGEQILSPNDYVEQLVEGFEQVYRFVIAHREAMLAVDGPLAALQDQPIRFIFRSTKVYRTVLQKTFTPEFCQDGVDYSLELDIISRAFLVDQQKPKAWPILAAELQVMAQLDIPYFQGNSASQALPLPSGKTIPQAFKQPSYEQVITELQQFSETNLGQQLCLIRQALYARVARKPTGETGAWEVQSLPPLTPDQLIQEACAIAREIQAKAIPDPNGFVNWIGMGFVSKAERFQLQLLGNSLYDGKCGIALFLSALDWVRGRQEFGELALQALQPLRKLTQLADTRQRLARNLGIGGAAGVSSIIYTFTKVSQFLGDTALHADAELLVKSITAELIATDQQLDVMGGAAGAILGLLPLYEATQDQDLLEKAQACANHLLQQRVSIKGSPKAWQTLREQPLTGFSHGAAGIAYALLRLYAVTQDHRYREAAEEGIAYERSVFSDKAGNWPDLREFQQDKGQPGFMVNWCHGAPGIALGRLGGLPILDTADIQQDIEVGLQKTQQFGLQGIDHLCCGNFGRIEVLLIAAQGFSRPDLRQLALQRATNVVARARRTGSYQLFDNLPSSVWSPGFFQGTAGIGYELLRLAYAKLTSVLLWQ